MLIDLLIVTLIVSGTFFILLGTLGLYRLPDLFCRAHALTKSMTLGILLLLTSMWLYLSSVGIGIKILVAIVFQFTTIPLSAHILGLLAWKKNIPRFKQTDIDRIS